MGKFELLLNHDWQASEQLPDDASGLRLKMHAVDEAVELKESCHNQSFGLLLQPNPPALKDPNARMEDPLQNSSHLHRNRSYVVAQQSLQD